MHHLPRADPRLVFHPPPQDYTTRCWPDSLSFCCSVWVCRFLVLFLPIRNKCVPCVSRLLSLLLTCPLVIESVVMGERFPVPSIGFSRLLIERSMTQLSEFHFLRAFLGPEQSYHFTESIYVPITGVNKFTRYFKICYYSYLQYNGHNTVYSVHAYANI